MKRFACMILPVCLFLLVIGGCATVKVGSPNYKATLLFFEGGPGEVKQGPDWLINRCNYGFAKEGIRVEFMPLGFNSPLDRLSEKHFLSMQEKVDSLKKRGHKRIWLMGISMGALSVRNAGCHGIKNVEGIIIVNPATFLGQIHLYCSKFVLPILIVIHEKDLCYERYSTTEYMKFIRIHRMPIS